jgi:hypothetical protein
MLHPYLLRFALVPMIFLVVLILVTASLIFLLAALFMTLASIMAPAEAALVTAVATLVVALAGLLTALWWLRAAPEPGRRRARLARGATSESASWLTAELGNLVGEDAMAYVEAHPKQTLLILFCTGLATGASPGLRKALRDLF